MHKQLPFLGKKTKPAEIRPDLWIPYARVDFTPGETWKGLLAYRKLIEYQKLRYYAWRKPGQPGIHKTRPELLEGIQDQSRTSVADLAKVLLESGEWEGQKIARRLKGIAPLRNRYENLWNHALNMVKSGKEFGKLAEAEERVNKAQNHKELILARTEVNKFKRAGEAVAAVEGAEMDEAVRERWSEEMRKMVEYKLTGKIEGYEPEEVEAAAAAEAEAEEAAAAKAAAKVAAAEARAAKAAAAADGSPAPTTETAEEQRSTTDNTLPAQRKPRRPLPKLVSVRWADLRDAEWAKKWPNSVQHDQIGYTSRDAPFGSRLGAPVADALNRRKADSVGQKSDWEIFHKIGSEPSLEVRA